MRYETNRHTQPVNRAERPLISNPIRPVPGSTSTIHVPWALAALVIMLALTVRGASATTTALAEYPLSASNSGPTSITTGPDGNLWFTENAGNTIGRITPAGVIMEFPLPTANSQPQSIAAGPDGNLWFTEVNGNKIGQITPAGTIHEFAVPTANSFPRGITAGPDGNVWFTEANGNKIGRISPAGVISEF